MSYQEAHNEGDQEQMDRLKIEMSDGCLLFTCFFHHVQQCRRVAMSGAGFKDLPLSDENEEQRPTKRLQACPTPSSQQRDQAPGATQLHDAAVSLQWLFDRNYLDMESAMSFMSQGSQQVSIKDLLARRVLTLQAAVEILQQQAVTSEDPSTPSQQFGWLGARPTRAPGPAAANPCSLHHTPAQLFRGHAQACPWAQAGPCICCSSLAIHGCEHGCCSFPGHGCCCLPGYGCCGCCGLPSARPTISVHLPHTTATQYWMYC